MVQEFEAIEKPYVNSEPYEFSIEELECIELAYHDMKIRRNDLLGYKINIAEGVMGFYEGSLVLQDIDKTFEISFIYTLEETRHWRGSHPDYPGFTYLIDRRTKEIYNVYKNM